MRKKWEEPKAEQQEAGDSSKQQQEGQRQTLGIQATDGAADDGTATAPAGDTGSLSVHKPARCVAFAQGPLADKYSTQDGHPDHEGKVARQRRSLGLSWGHDLTPSAVRALESGPDALGEECAPSLMRLKRRVGLLPLRKRPRDYLTWMLDDNSDWGEDREDAGSKGSKGRRSKQVKQGGSGGSCRGGDTAKAAVASKGSSKDSKGSSAKAGGSRLMVHKLGAKDGAAMKAAGEGSGTGKCAKQQQHIQPPRLKVPEGPMITYGRCKSGSVPADGSAVGIAQQQVVAQVGNGNRRLGGLSGPIGSIRSVLQPQPTGARLP